MNFDEMKQIQIFTNPKELREIADEMERKIAKLHCGDSTTTHIEFKKFKRLEFCWDQEKMVK